MKEDSGVQEEAGRLSRRGAPYERGEFLLYFGYVKTPHVQNFRRRRRKRLAATRPA